MTTDDKHTYDMIKDSILRDLKEQIDSEEYDFKSWNCQVGILLTKEQAKFIVNLIEGK